MTDLAVLERLFPHRLALAPPGEPVSLKSVPSRGGVCALSTENGTLVQVLATQSLRRALALRLAGATEKRSTRRADVSEVARRLWWQPTYSTFETSWTYLKIARQLWPLEYRRQLAFGPAWCACIDLDSKWPRWAIRNAPYSPSLTAVGPFETRKRCAAFIEALEDIFDLCRDHEVLRKAPNGERCAYFDMNKCAGPCDGTIDPGVYRAAIDDSVRFAMRGPCDLIDDLKKRMRSASQLLDFESAQRCREKLDRAEQLLRHNKRLMRSPYGERYLIVQSGHSRSFVRPFFFCGGLLESGDDASRKNLRDAADGWFARGWVSDNDDTIDASYRTDCLGLVAHFLAKADSSPGVFLRIDNRLEADAVVTQIKESFFRS